MVVPLAASLGCDALTVRSFTGTVMQFTFSKSITPASMPAGKHLELWARTQYDDIVRVDGYYDLGNGLTANGIMIRQAISLDDPCMIDGYYFPNNPGGNLLTTAAAYPSSQSAGGVTQTPTQQAQQVVDRIHQVTDNPAIVSGGGPLLAVLPYDAAVPPAVPDAASSADRRAACDAYVAVSDLTYIPNPYQFTAPLHGTVYGFVEFLSQSPPSDYDGFRIDTPLNLQDVREIFFTLEGATVDPLNRGPVFLTSTMTQGGRDVVHFSLTHVDPTSTASGTAALEVDPDQDSAQF